jgi:hypothetical protein
MLLGRAYFIVHVRVYLDECEVHSFSHTEFYTN